MTPATLRRLIAQLTRERAELSARLRVHASTDDDDVEAMTLYFQLQAIDGEIYLLKQMQDDLFLAGYLAEQGAAAVAMADKFLALEAWRIERNGRAAIIEAERILQEANDDTRTIS